MYNPKTVTDWNKYYSNPFPGSSITRKITRRVLLAEIKKYVKPNAKIVEYGGANSCFFDSIYSNIRPSEYHIVDTNQLGVDHFNRRIDGMLNIFTHVEDVATFDSAEKVDLCFSVGLIEHFDEPGTQMMIERHFHIVKPGGIVILTFPTPTWLYKVSRFVSESINKWIFHDERALRYPEVAQSVEAHGRILEKRIIWPIFFTQYHLVIRKNLPR